MTDGRLRQDPVDELAGLRTGECTTHTEIQCSAERSVPIDGSAEPALDLSITLHRGNAAATGLVLRSWLRQAQEGVPCAEVLVLDWDQSELQVATTMPHLSVKANSASQGLVPFSKTPFLWGRLQPICMIYPAWDVQALKKALRPQRLSF